MAGLAVATVFVLVASPALASDLGGTYVGGYTCKGIESPEGVKVRTTGESTLEITEVETLGNAIRLNVSIDGVLFSSRAIDRGAVDSGKGAGGLVRCGTSDSAWEGSTAILHYTFKVNPTSGKGSIRSTGASNSGFGDGVGFLSTCRYTWKRVSTDDPDVPPCPD